jgi:hypothetical protein
MIRWPQTGLSERSWIDPQSNLCVDFSVYRLKSSPLPKIKRNLVSPQLTQLICSRGFRVSWKPFKSNSAYMWFFFTYTFISMDS